MTSGNYYLDQRLRLNVVARSGLNMPSLLFFNSVSRHQSPVSLPSLLFSTSVSRHQFSPSLIKSGWAGTDGLGFACYIRELRLQTTTFLRWFAAAWFKKKNNSRFVVRRHDTTHSVLLDSKENLKNSRSREWTKYKSIVSKSTNRLSVNRGKCG